MPSTYILNYKECKMDIDRNLYFLKINCSSILEARKRALVLAYLTYDMTRHIFVKLNTGQMLENPYDHQNVYEVQELYNLQMFEDVIDVKTNIARQNRQTHQGMILTDKDAKTLENNTKFKSVELNENFINVDMNQPQPDKAARTTDVSQTEARAQSPEDLQISLYEAKKLNESHILSIK